jgi:DNA primase catalytic subunit
MRLLVFFFFFSSNRHVVFLGERGLRSCITNKYPVKLFLSLSNRVLILSKKKKKIESLLELIGHNP